MKRPTAHLVWIALLATTAALLYVQRLGSIAPYLSIEEVSQAREAVALAARSPDARGVGSEADNRAPLPEAPNPSREAGLSDAVSATGDPLWVYLAPLWVAIAAVLLRILPFSEALLRLPSAGAGVLNVVLMFIAGREIFNRLRPAVIAAVLLLFTPVHFLQSRIGTGQIGEITFVLAWLIFIAGYINHGRRRDLFAATLSLGLGMYAYAAGLIVMPVFFLVTLLIVRRYDAGSRTLAAACAGFGLAFLPLAAWHLLHPRHLASLAAYYTHGEYNKNLGWLGFLGPRAVSHFDAWWDCYSPDKLFFSGDPDLRFSTRSAGYFLLATAPAMVAGPWYARRLLRDGMWVALASGLLLGPLPAALVSNSEVKRWLTFVPFAVLATTCGVESMLANRRRVVQALAIGLLVLAPLQARGFLDDYFGRYPLESAVKFGGNVRGAIQEVFSESATDDCVFLDSGIFYLNQQWDLYTRVHGRMDLARRTNWLAADDRVEPSRSCHPATGLALAGDTRFADWRSTPVPELNGSVLFAVYRRGP
jgi:hypothetical protein